MKTSRCIADNLCSLRPLLATEGGIEESSPLGHVSALDPLKVLDFEAVLDNHLLMPTGILLDCDTHLAGFVVVGLDCVNLDVYWGEEGTRC